MKYLYGPVPSRRLGSSLGVDLVPHKVCSFDCIYCQLGSTTELTTTRKEYVPVNEVLAEVREFLNSGQKCDYITLSGSGEPTLNSDIGKIINGVKSLTDTPVAVLTNSSLFSNINVCEEISQADVVLPSLDAVTQEVFKKINRPHPGLAISNIMENLKKFTREFRGQVWLEVMLVDGVNTDAREMESMRQFIESMKPGKVQLNTVVRPPGKDYARPITAERLDEIANLLGAEVIADFKKKNLSARDGNKKELILNLLKRRPCTIQDISSALGFHENEIIKHIEILIREGAIAKEVIGKGQYFIGILEK